MEMALYKFQLLLLFYHYYYYYYHYYFNIIIIIISYIAHRLIHKTNDQQGIRYFENISIGSETNLIFRCNHLEMLKKKLEHYKISQNFLPEDCMVIHFWL